MPLLRSRLLHGTPIGTPKDSVAAYLRRHGWLDSTFTTNDFFANMAPRFGPEGVLLQAGTLRANFGSYHGLAGYLVFETNTEAFYGFDSTAHLTSVYVRKTNEGL